MLQTIVYSVIPFIANIMFTNAPTSNYNIQLFNSQKSVLHLVGQTGHMNTYTITKPTTFE